METLEKKLKQAIHNSGETSGAPPGEHKGIKRALEIVQNHREESMTGVQIRDFLDRIISHAHTLDLASTQAAELIGDPDVKGLSWEIMEHVRKLNELKEQLPSALKSTRNGRGNGNGSNSDASFLGAAQNLQDEMARLNSIVSSGKEIGLDQTAPLQKSVDVITNATHSHANTEE